MSISKSLGFTDVQLKKFYFFSVCSWLLLLYCEYVYMYVINIHYNMFDIYGAVYLFVDYSKGLIPRGLLGEILKYPISAYGIHFVDLLMLTKVIIVGCIFVCCAAVSYKVLMKQSVNNVFLLCMLSVHPLYLMSRIYGIRNDNVWYLFLPVMFWCIHSVKNVYLKMIILIACSTVCMLCHHAFIFVFVPLICVFLILDGSYRLFLLYSIFMLFEFMVINFGFRNYSYTDTVSMVYDKINKTDIVRLYSKEDIDTPVTLALYGEYGSSHMTQIFTDRFYLREYIDKHFPRFGYYICFSLSSIIVVLKVFMAWLKQNKRNWILLGIILLPFVFLLVFTVDCDRWFLMILFEMNILSMWLICRKTVDVAVKGYMYVVYWISIICNGCIYATGFY